MENTLQELIEKRLKHRLKQTELITEIENKIFREALAHETFAIKSLSRKIENKLVEDTKNENEIKQKNFNIRNFIDENFSSNPGYYKKVPFRLLMLGCEYLHIDTEFTKEGITRFQGVIVTRYNTPVLPGVEIFPFVRNWMLNSQMYNGMYPCYTIWFIKPITQEIIDKYMSDFTDKETKNLF